MHSEGHLSPGKIKNNKSSDSSGSQGLASNILAADLILSSFNGNKK